MTTPMYPEIHVQLTGRDGNAMSIITRVAGALDKAGQRGAATTFRSDAFAVASYGELLRLVGEYVSVG